MYNPQRAPRPRLTLAIIKYAVIDALGILLFALGLTYLVKGPGSVFASFPSTTADAGLTAAVGLALMLWAAARILRELTTQRSPDA